MLEVASTVNSATVESALTQAPEDKPEEKESSSIPYSRQIVKGGLILSALCLLATLAVIGVPVSISM
jgi:hypothetical protein